ncbi:MAG: MFS transporter [Longilinea sp.]|nr:MFS transporter [Longilinea sp.]MCA1954936.1 MFS transporter [Anaerolinea sp.]
MFRPRPDELSYLRLYYFLYIGSGAFLFPFIGLFYQQQGLSGTQIGLLATLGALVSMVAAPFWARLSRQVNRPRRMLQGVLLLSALLTILMGHQSGFWLLAVFANLRVLAASGISPVSDALTLSLTSKRQSGYGSVRLWGSLGWALIALIGGWWIQRSSLVTGFWAHAAGLGLCSLILFGIPVQANTTSAGRGSAAAAAWKTLQGQPLLIGLCVSLVVLWLTRNGVGNFEALYVKSLGGDTTIIGLMSTLGAFSEWPGMVLADRLVRKHGPGRVFAWGLLIWMAATGLMLLSPTVQMALFKSVFNGIGFSFFTVGMVMLINKTTPPEQTATILALILTTLQGLVTTLVSPLSGLAFDRMGAPILYWIAIGGMLLSWAIFEIFTLRANRLAAPK